MTNKGAQQAGMREQLVQELRGGADGVARWNARREEERHAVGALAGMDLTGAALAGVNLGGLDFSSARLDGASLAGGWLLECNLCGASLRKANLARAWCAGACFREASLQGAVLSGANLRGCDCRKADLGAANLAQATLDGADLCGADLSTSTLKGASMAHARYDADTRFPAGFEPAQAMEWAGRGAPPIAFDLFIRQVREQVDPQRLTRALDMLKAERFQLYSQVDDSALCGVVKSQTDEGVVYSCRLAADGNFSCCSQNLCLCMGLRNALCKHLLVLVVGLTRSRQIDSAVACRWIKASRGRRPALDAEVMSETFLRYKGAEAGEIDWRPTETIPEDYYAL
jgi:hypothetical protein